MTDEEKLQEFTKELQALQDKWGISLRPNINIQAFIVPPTTGTATV